MFSFWIETLGCRRMQCNKHVVKMVLETAQMLCANFPKEPHLTKEAITNTLALSGLELREPTLIG